MHELLCNVVLFTASMAFKKDTETTKVQLESIGKKFDDGKLNLLDYSPEIQNAIEFYLLNRSKLW